MNQNWQRVDRNKRAELPMTFLSHFTRAPLNSRLTRMQALHRKILIGFAVLAFTLAAGAQSTRTYQVELVIFKNLETPPVGEALDPEAFIELPESEPIVSGIFQPAPSGALILTETANRLDRASGFRPLAHDAWIQPGLAREEAPARNIIVTDGGVTVRGTARVYLSRYLHVELDLIFEGSDGLRYRLAERRRVRSNENHYFDHPAFGVIARITRLSD